ncbi:hypothetical protein HYV80_01660 [Candidatus Woesearchaeota archaeon]|nr:hypothetical protein [Candidatus Woesearchaeota archaeon]
MSLAHNKKGAQLSTLVEIILLLIAAGLILGIFEYAASRANEQTSEKLCRGFNALRAGTKIDVGPVKTNIAPRGCKTLDKKDLPGKTYRDYPGGINEGAKAELRNMIARCWWMWLEGKQPNIFDTSTLNLQNKCFVCYAFSLKNGADIKIPEFIASLDYPYEAADSSNRCAAGGEGGFCRGEGCDKSREIEVDSGICRSQNPQLPQIKCCISKNIRDECVNKGGICSRSPLEGHRLYEKWGCSQGLCYVKEENYMTYLDYVQGTKGSRGGAGFIVYEDKLKDAGLTTKKKYAVTLVSPGNTPGWDTAAWGAGTVIVGGGGGYLATKYGSFLPPFIRDKIFALVALATFSTIEMTHKSGTLAGYNFIYLSEYDTINRKCLVEEGVDTR